MVEETAVNSTTKDREVDSNLIRRLNKGEISAIEELYHLYFDRIYSMVYYQVGRDHKNAEEVVQEAWLAVVKSAKKFKGESQPYTWIYGIVWHKIKDFQRQHYKEKDHLQNPSDKMSVEGLQIIDSEPVPEEVIEKEETKELVRKALMALPDHYRQILTLKYLENMSAADIGHVMDKSTKSIESLLDRSRQALRDKIVELNG